MATDDFTALWAEAKQRYIKAGGKYDEDIAMPRSVDDLERKVTDQNDGQKHFREKQGTLFKCLRWALKPIETVGNIAAGAASSVFPPSQMCFGAVMYLIGAADGVSSMLDGIADLLDTLKDITVRLQVYRKEDMSSELKEKIKEILMTVIEILARSTHIVKDRLFRLKSFAKGMLIGKDTVMQDLKSKLEKLTTNEARLVGAETLVEAKRTGRGVDALQEAAEQSAAQLSHLSISADETSAGVAQILMNQEDLKTQAKVERDKQQSEDIRKFLFPDGKTSTLAQDRLDEIRHEQVLGSGEWVCSEESLHAWMEGTKSFLWIYGTPGSGKSFLTSTLLSFLHQPHPDLARQPTHVTIGYFFFRDNQDKTRSFAQALRDTSFQLTQANPVYAKHVANIANSGAGVNTIRSAWRKLFAEYFLGDGPADDHTFLVFDGVDEAFQEDRRTAFELFEDLHDPHQSSRLQIAMIGRPQVLEEFGETLASTMFTIEVTSMKNGDDIAHYVDASIAKQSRLKNLKQPLRSEIIQTLSSKAGGMFMWVKLMIAELNSKRSPNQIKDALNKAPSGLTAMLKHILESFSDSLNPEDADDLNDILAWVTLAKRPLSLGEVDAMLRIKYQDEFLGLENMLRKQYASLFTLTREDRLTTGDLQKPKVALEDEDTTAGADPGEGMDDVENPIDFNSNPRTTTISFSHASISDFFRDPTQTKVSIDDHPAVGLDANDARLAIARNCVKLIVEDTLQELMKDAVSLRPYANNFWKEHLDEVQRLGVKVEVKAEIASSLQQMMRDEAVLRIWTGARSFAFHTKKTADDLLEWLTEQDVVQRLPEDATQWIDSRRANAVTLFEPAMKYTSRRWLCSDKYRNPGDGLDWNVSACCVIILSYIAREAGEVVDKVTKLTVSNIGTASEWAALEETAEWHRRLGMTYRDNKFYDLALQSFHRALELDPKMWVAQAGISMIYESQKKYQETLDSDVQTLNLANTDADAKLWNVHIRMAVAYNAMYWEIDVKTVADVHKKMNLLKSSLDSRRKAFAASDTDFDSIEIILFLLDRMRDPPNDLVPFSVKGKLGEGDLPDSKKVETEIIDTIKSLDAVEKDGTTNFVLCLQKLRYDAGDFIKIIGQAAVDFGMLEWLEGKYKDAIAFAHRKLDPVTSITLQLGLATLCKSFGNDGDRAARIWESIGAELVTSSALDTWIGYARSRALNLLGEYYLCQAVDNESTADQYVAKMERIVARRKSGLRTGLEDSIPPNDVAIYLAAWYHRVGRHQEALDAVKPHVRDGIAILSDDDPSNDVRGYAVLASAIFAIGDDENAIASFHAMREYEKDDNAVIYTPDDDNGENAENGEASDASSTQGDGDDENGDDADSDSDDDLWSCDGTCGDCFSYYDGVITCRYCQTTFCKDCRERLNNGQLPFKICNKDHDFLQVPYVTKEQSFKKGQMLVAGKIMSIEQWKAGVKRQYSI